ncbi:MAG TPA: DMT family transporter [Gemmatimonadaceae bacterium]|nr:DMT family transporter [Gemmatimonadaceae bacterium]
MSTATGARNGARAWLVLILLSLIWGSSFILMKEGLEGFDALQLALIRMSVAALCLTPLALKHLRGLGGRELALLFVVGLTGNALPAFLYAKSETVLPTAVVGVLTSMTPIFSLLVAWLFFRQRFPRANVIGIVVGLLGAVALAMAGSPEAGRTTNLAFAGLVLIATISYGVNVNLVKNFFGARNMVFVTSIALSAVGWPALIFLLTGTSFIENLRTNPAAPAALGYIAILGAFGTALSVLLFNQLLKDGTIIFATSVTYTIPIVAVLWGIFLHEAFTTLHALAFAVILIGVWLANRRPAAAPVSTASQLREADAA